MGKKKPEGEAAAAASGTADTVKPAREPKAPKEKKESAPRTVGGHALDTRITFGVHATKDKEGKDVTVETNVKDQNPKRAGSKSAERFANYKKNMTIEQALAAGMSSGNIAHDLEMGYIKTA